MQLMPLIFKYSVPFAAASLLKGNFSASLELLCRFVSGRQEEAVNFRCGICSFQMLSAEIGWRSSI